MSSIPLGIVNMALSRIGAKSIASLADGSSNSLKINNVYAFILGQVLQAADWKFAKTRATLTRATIKSPILPPTLGSTSGSSLLARTYSAVVTLTNDYGETKPSPPVSLAILANNKATLAPAGDLTYATGWNAYVDILGGTAYTLQNTTPNALTATLTEGNSGFTNTGAAPPTINNTRPLFGYRFAYALPSDYLRLVKPHVQDRRRHGYGEDGFHRLREEDSPVWPVNHHYIFEALPAGSLALMTDYDDTILSLRINYIRTVTNYLLYSPTFINCLAFRLAQELAVAITESVAKSQEMEKLYNGALESADTVNQTGDSLEDETGGHEWENAGRD